MYLIMLIQVSYVNQLPTTKTLGQLHIFQACSQHKTEVSVQLKKKLMQYWKAYKDSITTLEVWSVPFNVIINPWNHSSLEAWR